MSDYDSGIKRLKSSIEELGLPEAEFRAKRYNQGKPRPSLIPVEWIEELMTVMDKGAIKYGDDNWKLAMPYKECLDSLERHLMEFKKRIDFDPDDGLRTITKVAVNALFLAYWQMKGLGDDNR